MVACSGEQTRTGALSLSARLATVEAFEDRLYRSTRRSNMHLYQCSLYVASFGIQTPSLSRVYSFILHSCHHPQSIPSPFLRDGGHFTRSALQPQHSKQHRESAAGPTTCSICHRYDSPDFNQTTTGLNIQRFFSCTSSTPSASFSKYLPRLS